MSGPRIICWDLETAPNLVKAHDLYNERVLPYHGIVQEKYIICGSWKELGKRLVHTAAIDHKDPTNDYEVVKAIHAALSECDAAVAHFGDKFDMRMFNARAIYHGFAPLPPIVQIDTYKIAKSKFKFNSNKLDYLGIYLKVGRKVRTSHDLWDGCMAGDPAAIAKMVKYNQQDVRLLEKVFERLRVYVPSKLNVNTFTRENGCPTCGELALQCRGYSSTKTGRKPRYQCSACGSWSTGSPEQLKTITIH